jgi:hypothetical protein
MQRLSHLFAAFGSFSLLLKHKKSHEGCERNFFFAEIRPGVRVTYTLLFCTRNISIAPFSNFERNVYGTFVNIFCPKSRYGGSGRVVESVSAIPIPNSKFQVRDGTNFREQKGIAFFRKEVLPEVHDFVSRDVSRWAARGLFCVFVFYVYDTPCCNADHIVTNGTNVNKKK